MKYKIQKCFGIWFSSRCSEAELFDNVFHHGNGRKVLKKKLTRLSKLSLKEVSSKTLSRGQHKVSIVNKSDRDSFDLGASDGSACCSMAHK